jgi:murein DD-endopeptidase MepM/ murein hydrolase activator NlpD
MKSIVLLLVGILLGGAGVAAYYERGRAEDERELARAEVQAADAAKPADAVSGDAVDAGAWPPPDMAQAPATPVPTPPSDLATPGSIAPPMPATVPGTDPALAGDAGALAPLGPPPSQALAIPVQGVAAEQLADTYTQSRGEGRSHDAIDIMAPRGTPVLAVEDGRIAKLFLSKPGGITLYQFDPSERIAYYYAHLEGYAPGIAEGKLVKRGDVIGYVGSTGNASPDGPHLHFAIFALGPEKRWWQGTPVNPYPLLAAKAPAPAAVAAGAR